MGAGHSYGTFDAGPKAAESQSGLAAAWIWRPRLHSAFVGAIPPPHAKPQ